MNTTKIVFFAIFGIFLIFFVIYSWVIFYHIRRFGYKEGVGEKAMTIFIIVACLVVGVTILLALAVDWNIISSTSEIKFNLPIFGEVLR